MICFFPPFFSFDEDFYSAYFHSIFECLCLLADVISEGGDGILSCSVIGDNVIPLLACKRTLSFCENAGDGLG